MTEGPSTIGCVLRSPAARSCESKGSTRRPQSPPPHLLYPPLAFPKPSPPKAPAHLRTQLMHPPKTPGNRPFGDFGPSRA
jgi:hypothetical protein